MDKEIYNYLLQNHIGYDNRVKATVLMDIFNIHDNKTFRSYIAEARNDIECTYFIASEAGKQGGYWIATKEQDRDITLRNLILRAIRIIKNARRMKRKKLYEKGI